MPHSNCLLRRNLGKAPPLSAIIHGSNPTRFEDGFFLPSSCHCRTWLLDDFQETCSETTTHQLTNCEVDQFIRNACVQSSCLPRVVQTTSSSFKWQEARGSCPAKPQCASQFRQSGNSQQRGYVTQGHQSASYKARSCPQSTPESKSCQTVEYESSQCHCHIHNSSSCGPVSKVAPGPQLLEASSTSEGTCCVTGGLQSPSK
uniref:Keratin-associated protein n=1 Tax=Jaculus jaculus TaxID=51337 RepID=A0A8C5K199_JACJA